MLAFRVDGVPIPQGSKTVARGGGKAWLRDANGVKLAPWRRRVADAAAEAASVGQSFDCPVWLVAVFYLPAPKRPRWWVPAVKPDLDKLMRALGDGIVDGGLIRDDSRITVLALMKRYATETNPPGVRVLIMEEVK